MLILTLNLILILALLPSLRSNIPTAKYTGLRSQSHTVHKKHGVLDAEQEPAFRRDSIYVTSQPTGIILHHLFCTMLIPCRLSSNWSNPCRLVSNTGMAMLLQQTVAKLCWLLQHSYSIALTNLEMTLTPKNGPVLTVLTALCNLDYICILRAARAASPTGL